MAWPRLRAAIRPLVSLDLLLLGGFVALGLAVRWPDLLAAPAFPSVALPVLKALEVAGGQALPLVDQAPYLGPLFVYLLALVYKLAGPSLESTMVLAWLVGGLTIVPTYLLGRELGGRLVGSVAAALLATSAAHIVISSHVPWVHSLTPLAATTTLWLLARALRREHGPSLALAGLAAGVSLQTHPTVLPIFGGAFATLLFGRSRLLRTRWLGAALALAVLGYSPLLIHHLQTNFVVVADVQGKQARYLDADVEEGEDSNRGLYLSNLQSAVVSTIQMASGSLDEDELSLNTLRHPMAATFLLLALLGLVVAAWRGEPFLLLVLLPGLLLPPFLNGKYQPVLDGRYLMPLLPLLFVGIGLAAEMSARPLYRTVGPAGWLVLGAGLLLLTVQPLQSLAEFYEDSRENGDDNSLYLRTVQQLRSARRDDEVVFLDPELRGVKTTGGGNAGTTLSWLLPVSGLPAATWSGREAAPLVGHLAVLGRESAKRVERTAELIPLENQPSNGRNQPSYRAYRVVR